MPDDLLVLKSPERRGVIILIYFNIWVIGKRFQFFLIFRIRQENNNIVSKGILGPLQNSFIIRSQVVGHCQVTPQRVKSSGLTFALPGSLGLPAKLRS